jgi:GT2 family glycosyltransferase
MARPGLDERGAAAPISAPDRAATTVVIATRDRRERLLETLDRLRDLREDPPVVVVDNGSADGSPGAIHRRHPGVEVIEAGRNLGPSARTLGVRRAATPFVAFNDDDSWWAPGALDRAAAMLRAHERLALVAARVLVEPGGRVDPTCRLMERSPLAPDAVLGLPQVLGFVACGAVVRRSAFLAVGGFAPRLPIGGEETLLAIDLMTAGWTLVHAPDVVAHHEPGVSGRPRPGRRRAQLVSALWTAWLRRPLPRAMRITADVLSSAGPDAPAALAAAARGLPWIVRERRAVPPRTEAALRAVERAAPAA